MILLANEEGRSGVAAAMQTLRQSGAALDAIELGIRAVEKDPSIGTVGLGGAPNLLGEVECDASIMDGRTLETGAVGALKGYLHAVSVARKVMERLPHAFLVGEGAARFAGEIEAVAAPMLTADAKTEHDRWFREHASSQSLEDWPNVPLAELAWTSAKEVMKGGTTIFLAVDQAGNMAGGVSSSGAARKYPGRLGDSPIIGAGLYVDGRHGACACTHTGEMSIRTVTAHSVVQQMKRGATVSDACHGAAHDLLSLKKGHLGSVVIHAIDREGTPFVLATGPVADDVGYHYWDGSANEPIQGRPAFLTRAGDDPS
ncbi:isoaspartyl peptidase/L-asparaginase [Candidatus Eisenbacteria bacterium]|uniref:Isoaspartyl peptidase/L-asparaginase n=1 Tax=Eiseniibacteriota bacterium TaxID=2212470 RepID=A0ABV6YJL9_UNCEI